MYATNLKKMLRHTTLALLGLTALIAPMSSAQAQVPVYDNGSYSGATGAAGFSASAVADDFTVTAPLTFNGVRFWAFDIPSGLHPNFSGDISWYLYSGSTGAASPNAIPDMGTIFSQGTATPTVTATGDFYQNRANFAIAQLDFSIPTQTLGAGTYWLRLKEGGLNTPFDGSTVYWLQTGQANTGNGFRMDNDPLNPTSWASASGGTATTKDLAYQLTYSTTNTAFSSVTPEAPGMVQLVAGLLPVGALYLFTQRRRQKTILSRN